MDFGALPPEINSARMYAGTGPGSLLSSATAWQELAGELNSAATSYRSVVEGLTSGAWTGPSALAMAAAAGPYATWLGATGAQAQQAAAQLTAAVGAYETAYAATVPPSLIAANRSLQATLVATNILGQNTAVIAATEAVYLEMWPRTRRPCMATRAPRRRPPRSLRSARHRRPPIRPARSARRSRPPTRLPPPPVPTPRR